MRLEDNFDDSEKEENQWKNRIDMILFQDTNKIYDPNNANDNFKPYFIDWPKDIPKPRPLSKVIYLGDSTIAVGKDESGYYIDVLKQSWVLGSSAYHWIEYSEDPKNSELFPHLNPRQNYLNNHDGPNTDELKKLDDLEDINPEDELGEAA